VEEAAPAHSLGADESGPFETIRLPRQSTVVELELPCELGDGRRPIRVEVHARKQAALSLGAEDR
jgi:hypothetical protein